jgi:glutathione S-transferase
MASDQDLILYFYTFSPYARKVTAYLALRGIPYTECQQPFTMPRPDLAAIGVKYRRIPVLSIGRDLYCDSALILEKLEKLYPGSHMGGKTGTDKALIKLLQKWTDLDVFPRACESIPPDFPAMSDPTFLKDREELWGREWSKERQERMRAEALQSMRDNFEFLETMMSDERKWILESDGPSLADINGVFFPVKAAWTCVGSIQTNS